MTTIRSPNFWHSRSTKWCIKLSKESTNLKVWFVLLSSQRDLSVKADLKATVKLEGEESALEATSTGTLNQLGQRHFVFRLANCAENLSVSCEVSLPPEPHSVTADLVTLLTSGDHSDIVLCAKGVELKAHSVLLAAHSPVFATMICHDTREAQKRKFSVNDVDREVLEQVLLYIYTSSTLRIKDMVNQLLVVAEKFRLLGLKSCEQELAEGLTVENAAATAVIALTYTCDLLKPAVVSFIKDSVSPVVRSDGWGAAMRKNPREIVELTCLIAENSKV